MGPAPLKHYVTALYDQLRAIARARMAGQRTGHTLDPTGLANEAIVRLLKCDAAKIDDEEHFLVLAAEAMRQILVDHARARSARKRGGGEMLRAQTFDEPTSGETDPSLVLAVDESLEKLRAEDPRAAKVVELRFFAGLEMKEIADAMETSERTVHREWTFARARLLQMLGDDEPEARGTS